MGRTREELTRLILEGNVIVGKANHGKKRIYGKLDELPSAIDLAGNDIVKKQHALGELKKQAEAAQAALMEAAAQEGISPDEIEIPEEQPEVPVAGKAAAVETVSTKPKEVTVGRSESGGTNGISVKKQGEAPAQGGAAAHKAPAKSGVTT